MVKRTSPFCFCWAKSLSSCWLCFALVKTFVASLVFAFEQMLCLSTNETFQKKVFFFIWPTGLVSTNRTKLLPFFVLLCSLFFLHQQPFSSNKEKKTGKNGFTVLFTCPQQNIFVATKKEKIATLQKKHSNKRVQEKVSYQYCFFLWSKTKQGKIKVLKVC